MLVFGCRQSNRRTRSFSPRLRTRTQTESERTIFTSRPHVIVQTRCQRTHGSMQSAAQPGSPLQDLPVGSPHRIWLFGRCAPADRGIAMSTPVCQTNKVVTFPEMNILIHCVCSAFGYFCIPLGTGLLRTIDHRWSTLTVIFNPLIIRAGLVDSRLCVCDHTASHGRNLEMSFRR